MARRRLGKVTRRRQADDESSERAPLGARAETGSRMHAVTLARARSVAALAALALCAAATTSRADEPPPAATPDAEPTSAPSSAPPSAARATRELLARDPELDGRRPSPLEVDYAQYGVGIAADVVMEPGAICPESVVVPCIVGSGGGPVLRGGYRPSGPFYVGGAYQFSKLDSSNLYRLGILQELRAEMRYFLDTRARVAPFVTWGLGGVVYGNEFGVETGGVSAFLGGGFEFEVSRSAVVGANIVYRPVLLAGYTDAAGLERATGIVQFLHLEFLLELRTELHRE